MKQLYGKKRRVLFSGWSVYTALLVAVLLLLSMPNTVSAELLFNDNFESYTVGSVPAGWNAKNPGVTIGTTNTTSSDGSQSVFMQGTAYSGSNLHHNISVGTSGVINYSFMMKVDTTGWAGGNGFVGSGISSDSSVARVGVMQEGGVYKLLLGYSTVVDSPVSVSNWVLYSATINLDTKIAYYYVNGAFVGSAAMEVPADRNVIELAAGSASAGNPAAYFDSVQASSAPTPVPGAAWLLGSGLIGLFAWRRRRLSK